jgi:hypothetical protein
MDLSTTSSGLRGAAWAMQGKRSTTNVPAITLLLLPCIAIQPPVADASCKHSTPMESCVVWVHAIHSAHKGITKRHKSRPPYPGGASASETNTRLGRASPSASSNILAGELLGSRAVGSGGKKQDEVMGLGETAAENGASGVNQGQAITHADLLSATATLHRTNAQSEHSRW